MEFVRPKQVQGEHECTAGNEHPTHHSKFCSEFHCNHTILKNFPMKKKNLDIMMPFKRSS